MSTLSEQVAQLQSAIAAHEALRPILGDASVDSVIAMLRAQMDLLLEPQSVRALDAQLDQLAAADLIRVVQDSAELTYIFKHALTQEAAYHSLLLHERRAIHSRIAAYFESRYAQRLDDIAPLLAHHYAQAGNDERTVEYSLRAAEAAARQFAYAEGAMHYARALDALKRLPDTEEQRRRRVDSIARYVELAFGSTVPQKQLARLAEAESLARSLHAPDGTLGDPIRLARVHTMMAAMNLARNNYREVIAYTRQVLAAAAVLGEPQLTLTPSAQLGAVLLLQGQFGDVAPHLEHAISLLGKDVGRWEWAWSVTFLALARAMRGQISEAFSEFESALARMHATNNAVGTVQCSTNVLAAYLEAGDMTRLVAASEQAISSGTAAGIPLFVAIGLGFQALGFSRLGQHEQAHQRMAESRALGARMGGQFMMSDWLSAFDAEIILNAGNPDGALIAAEQALKLAQSFADVFAEGWALRVYGQALVACDPSRRAAAVKHLHEALQLFESGQAVLEAARTHVALGDLAQLQGDELTACEHFKIAAARFQASGLLEQWARTLT